ncbi:MAG: hypothetical protein ACYC96_02585 [Fimbriimonadaceae bacterium]
MRLNSIQRFCPAVIFALGLITGAHGQYNTVGAYDATPTLGMPINDAASNFGANGITRANFTTMIAAAFAANTGGDIDFEPGNNWTAATIPMNTPVNMNYGVSLSNQLSVSRTDSTIGATGWFSGSPTAFLTSGTNYLGFAGAGTATFTFGSGLLAVGISMIPQPGQVSQTTLTATLSNLTTITTSTEATNSTADAIFFGIAAPSGATITALSFNDQGSVRYDDLGFVVAPAPEPVSCALLAAGAVALLRRRKAR